MLSLKDLKHVGTGAEKTAAEKEVNRQKNRYTNILPHDASRIKLEGSEIDDGTDYINANWMPVSLNKSSLHFILE